jgi:hypothetical protein
MYIIAAAANTPNTTKLPAPAPMPEMTAERVIEQAVAPPPIARHHQSASRI